MTFSLTSTAFTEGGQIPRKYTCDGSDLSPPLAWSGLPTGTKTLVLTCSDPDAPRGTFQHWAAYNIPPELPGLDEGITKAKHNLPFAQAVNDFRQKGYNGPCPPRGHGPHHYHFRLSALRDRLEGIAPRVTCAEVIARAKALEIAAVELIGVYER